MNGTNCADVPLRICSLTHSSVSQPRQLQLFHVDSDNTWLTGRNVACSYDFMTCWNWLAFEPVMVHSPYATIGFSATFGHTFCKSGFLRFLIIFSRLLFYLASYSSAFIEEINAASASVF